ncbi:MAG: HAMP domain-containing protein [Thiotrichales bacterium]|jgi:two-component system, NarL family, nitrate/nitrite sensor histidine kinase NarX|nr:HAMP domain-containing protein [Thiotrichales bacterium]MBT3613878.1 HAMP domain-containing protein [Thiotrichales bacterium]MBT3752954.1 HAMP domain-containing protein [Thiotrichales bacterium]MBT3838172.1 HAMP domain-containing protein [Thiotrichales bacterium]MBT4151810.1 HAMP domain-containing protein [Thiotrichales bacterium]
MKTRKQSLILRFGFVFSGIILLTFISMLSSIIISESISGMGSAINQAGSLRMQSFQIATEIIYSSIRKERTESSEQDLIEKFDQRLHNPRLKLAIPNDPDSSIYKSYYEVERVWEYQMKPIIYVYQQTENIDNRQSEFAISSREAIQKRYIALVHHFVDKIDLMVTALELEIEHKVKLLNTIETIILFIALIIVITSTLFIYTSLLTPLHSLLTAIHKIREGDFSYKAIVNGENELSDLANTFNSMSSELADTYISQKSEISEKSTKLEQQRIAMELLYNTSDILSSAPTQTSSYQLIIDRIKKFLDITSGTICISSQSSNSSGYILATDYSTNTENNSKCRNICSDCHIAPEIKGEKITIPINYNEKSYGLLLLESNPEKPPSKWQLSTLKIVAEQISTAFHISQGAIKEQESILNNERSSIARELHDSLAQSLTYLKIEASRLQSIINIDNNPSAHTIVNDMREEISNAYRQLRELLTTFRLTIETDEFSSTVEQAIKDFQQRGVTKINSDIRISECHINPHEAVHLVYILRETLNNIFKHAQAENAWIELRCSPSKLITLSVQDDGVGIDDKLIAGKTKYTSYGLTILKERVIALNGKYSIKPRIGGGTTFSLTFLPLDYNSNRAKGDISVWLNQI